jgi:hypothetical protein
MTDLTCGHGAATRRQAIGDPVPARHNRGRTPHPDASTADARARLYIRRASSQGGHSGEGGAPCFGVNGNIGAHNLPANANSGSSRPLRPNNSRDVRLAACSTPCCLRAENSDNMQLPGAQLGGCAASDPTISARLVFRRRAQTFADCGRPRARVAGVSASRFDDRRTINLNFRRTSRE